MLVWLSATNSHLKMLDRALSSLKFSLPDLSFNLDKRRKVGCLTLLFKIWNNPAQPLYSKLPGTYLQKRTTRYALSLNGRAFSAIYFKSEQFWCCFLPLACKIWSELPDAVAGSPNLQSFKTAVNAFYSWFLTLTEIAFNVLYSLFLSLFYRFYLVDLYFRLCILLK